MALPFHCGVIPIKLAIRHNYKIRLTRVTDRSSGTDGPDPCARILLI